VVDMDVDFLAFSSHKMCGPMGIGVLYGKEHLLESMPPYQGGGEMIKHVRLDGFEPNTLPYKFEAGTPNVEGAVGLSAAIDYISQIGMQTIHQHDSELVNKTLQGLEELPEVRILGPKTNRGGLVAFSINNIHAHDVAAYLDRYGVAVRAGHHCAHPLAQRFGIVSSVRASYYFYNSTDEVEELLRLVKKAICEL
jgi:cysteine desulfurase/selenocysteine lyase